MFRRAVRRIKEPISLRLDDPASARHLFLMVDLFTTLKPRAATIRRKTASGEKSRFIVRNHPRHCKNIHNICRLLISVVLVLSGSIAAASAAGEAVDQPLFLDTFEVPIDAHLDSRNGMKWSRHGWRDGKTFGEAHITDEIPAKSGKYCLKVNMKRREDTKSRTEIGLKMRDALNRYRYSFSIFIPETIDLTQYGFKTGEENGFVIAQFCVFENNGGIPDFALCMGADHMLITHEKDTQEQIVLWKGPIIQGKWVDWNFDINWSTDDNGSFHAYQNGVPVVSQDQMRTSYGSGATVRTRLGLYAGGWYKMKSLHRACPI